ncbi:MAG TPA: hypothetical protein DD789_06390, partial [Firmicutes bacterium]|nr:hypothetical protein [Bacillota bacterium]
EFFPEEGKYHWDGHRACGLSWPPEQTYEAGGKCPVCGRRVTIGVLHRITQLADRAVEGQPPTARPAQRLIPLVTIVAAVVNGGEGSQKVQRLYEKLLACHGSELHILRETPLAELARTGGEQLAEGVRRVRQGLLEVKPGFDGVYGEVKIFS